MLRTSFIKCFSVKHLGVISIRSMATKLKDFVSYYDILEINPECTKTEIREAWLKMSMLYHPDLNKDNPETVEKFMEIKEAYTTLINDEKRKVYNDKIGFYHSDPPPDFKREWTLEGETQRTGATAYHVMWSEDAIRKLMSSEKLRSMNWNKMPPADRYRILEEEKKKQFSVKAELERTSTLSLKEGSDRYWTMICLVGLVVFAVLVVQRSLGDDKKTKRDFIDEVNKKKDVLLDSGTLIHFTALSDIQGHQLDTPLIDPNNPNNFWGGKVGARESLATPSMTPTEAKQFQKFRDY